MKPARRLDILKLLLSGNYLTGAIAALLVQQISVALSVYFITKSATALPDFGASLYWFAWYALSLVFPYLPGQLSNYLFELWSADCVRQFQSEAMNTGQFRPTHFNNQSLKETNSTAFANAAPAIIQDTCGYLHDLAATALNSLFSIFAIAAVISGDVLVSYAISLFGCILYTWWFSSKATERAERSEEARIDFVAHTEGVWPVITLGNATFNEQWRSRYTERFDAFWTAAVAEKRLRNTSSFVLSLISVVPTTGLMVWLFLNNSDDPKAVAALLVTAPRAFQLLTMLGYFSSLVFEFHQLKGRMSVLGTLFAPPPEEVPRSSGRGMQARWADATWDLEVDQEEFMATVAIARSGRIVITGPNGAGKSTLLLHLKERLGERAVYLPASPLSGYGQSLSSGERKLMELDVILGVADVHGLLLDEWDANLDQTNRDRINSLLRQAALSRLVVEVRHRIPEEA